MDKIDHESRSDELLEFAEQLRVEDDFFFVTTFERYQVQIKATPCRIQKSYNKVTNKQISLIVLFRRIIADENKQKIF